AVEEIMTTDIQAISTDTPVTDAADIVSERGFLALPVVEDSTLVGVVRTNRLINAVADEETRRMFKKAGFRV
ncbi:CBS domain-containing protein, partial [Halorubrum vacuolatum]